MVNPTSKRNPLLLSAVVVGLFSMAERDLTTAGTVSLWILPFMIIAFSALEIRTDVMKVKEVMAKNSLKGV